MGTISEQKCKFSILLLVFGCCVLGRSAAGQTVAQDSANFADYAPQRQLENWTLINGGYGYGLWTPLADSDGGFVYIEGVSANERQVDGQYSFGIHVGNASYGVSRPLSNSLPAATFSILTRFDVEGHSWNLVGLRSGNNTSSFSSGELLAFGIVQGNQLFYRDARGTNLMNSGDARGYVWSWSVNFNAAAGTYSLSVTNVAGGFGQTFAGNLEASNTTVGSFAVINSSPDDDPDFIFDLPTFAAPLQPAMTWTNPAPIVYGTALGSAQLNASANVPGSFTYSPPAGTVLNAGTNFLSVVFTPSNTMAYPGITNFVSLVVLPEQLTVTANSLSRAYGQTNPVFTGTIDGLTNGDDITASYTCSATSNSPPGTYPIVPVLNDPGDRLGNYAVTTNAGTLTVTCPVIALSPPALPGGTVGIPYNQGLAASGGAAPYTFALGAGLLPPGLNLSSTGVLSGTPTNACTNTFTITASDANGCSDNVIYTVGVIATPLAANGTLKAAYGPALTTQTINTGFGDSTVGDGTSAGGSELDAAYGTVTSQTLYLFLSGNLEDNGNHINVFIADGRAGGQNTLNAPCCSLANMDGSVFSPGFNATYVLDVNDYQGTLYVDEYDLVTNSYTYLGSIPLTGGIGAATLGGIQIGFNNTNAAGVNGNTGTAADAAAADAVTSGLEIGIPLSVLGNPAQGVQVLANINGIPDNYLSDQFLPGLPVGTQDLGAGGSYSGPEPGAFNLSSLSNFWFTVSFTGPSITNEPENEILPPGATAGFSVGASGAEPLSYQWFFDGTNLLADATNAMLVISNVQAVNAGFYSVLVSNAYGSVWSSNATLMIGPPGDYWINPAGGNWSEAANWLNDTVPASGDNVYIVQSGVYTVDQDVNAALSSLTIAPADNNSVNVIVHTNVELFVTNVTETGFVDIGTGGSLTLAGGYLELDNLVLTNGGSFTNIAGTIVYAKAYQLENGGTVSVNGGSINTATNFTLGGMTNSSGALVINNGGSLTVSNATLGVGDDGTTTNGSGNGSVTVSNATLTAEVINLGSSAGGLGSLTIQSNASVTVSSNLTVVSGSKAIPSVVSISGGSLIVTNPGSVVEVGSVGSGAMTIAGGQHIINQIHLGSSNGAGTGSLFLLGGHLHILSNMSANFIVVDGIDIDGSGGSIVVGEGGPYNVAEFEVYAGTATNWSTMNVGYVAPGGLAGAGLYVQSGGNVTFTNTVTVGDDSNVNAVGQLTLKGGSLYITNASHTGTLNIRNGSVDLNGGTLVVDILILTNTSGVFQNNGGTFSFGQLIQSGGSIVMTNEVINTGKTTVLGGTVTTPPTVQYVTNSTHNATLNIVNGTFVVSNGATLVVDTLVITNANGHFKKMGGTLIAGKVILAPFLDADGDGQSNTNELLAGTDPLDPASLFQMVNSQPDPNGQDMDLSWTTEPFHSYVVQEATNAPDGTISPFADLSQEIFAPGFGPSVATYTDYGALLLYPGRYYRVRLGP